MQYQGNETGVYTLWGAPLSVYTAKVRSYLIKKRVPYRELFPSHPDFFGRIMPRVGYFVIPVLEAPDGTLVQDSSDILDHLEARFPEPCLAPTSPVQRAVAALLCAFGSEGLNQPSMHYRWSFLSQHGDFVRVEFGRALSTSKDRGERATAAEPFMAAMQDHLPRFGISTETIPAIEESYLALLAALDEHFLHHPYLLGGRPSIADFGFMVGLHAHLSRDPVPSVLMKTRAPNVSRWSERMNLANLQDGEFPDRDEAYPPNDEIPETLEPVLAHVFRDWGAELAASISGYHRWLDDHPSAREGDLLSLSDERVAHPSLGPIGYELRGRPMARTCAPQTLWHFDRAASAARALKGDARARFEALLDRTRGRETMALELARPIRRENNVLVLT